MTASEIKTAIENGTREFISVSKQAKYTVKKLPIIKWWRADITDIRSGNHKGVCIGSTLETFCEDLSKTRDLKPFTESDLAASIGSEDLEEMDYSITPSEMLEMIQLANKGYLATAHPSDTLIIQFYKGNETKTFEFPHC